MMKNKSLKRLSDFKNKQLELPKSILGGAAGQCYYYQNTQTSDNCADQNQFGDGPVWGYIKQTYLEQP